MPKNSDESDRTYYNTSNISIINTKDEEGNNLGESNWEIINNMSPNDLQNYQDSQEKLYRVITIGNEEAYYDGNITHTNDYKRKTVEESMSYTEELPNEASNTDITITDTDNYKKKDIEEVIKSANKKIIPSNADTNDRTYYNTSNISIINTKDEEGNNLGESNWEIINNMSPNDLQNYQDSQEKLHRVDYVGSDNEKVSYDGNITHTSDYKRKTVEESMSYTEELNDKVDINNLTSTQNYIRSTIDSSFKNYTEKLSLEINEDITSTNGYERKNIEDSFENLSSIKNIPISAKETDVTSTQGYSREYYNTIMKYINSDDLSVAESYVNLKTELEKEGSWGERVLSTITAILNKNPRYIQTLPEKDIQEALKAIYPGRLQKSGIDSLSDITIDTPNYQLGRAGGSAVSLNPSSYLRWAVEETVGKIPLKGWSKQMLIDETLGTLWLARDKLERATGQNKDRLPGNTSTLGKVANTLMNTSFDLKSIGSTVKSGLNLAMNLYNDIKSVGEPVNRPSSNNGSIIQPRKTGNQTFNLKSASIGLLNGVSSVIENTSTETLGKDYTVWKSNRALNGELVFQDNYISDERWHKEGNVSLFRGMDITLSELCELPNGIIPSTVENFKKALEWSPYMTTSSKVTSSDNNPNTLTLDSNHVWEIKFEPYTGPLNGFVSWLPSIDEINLQNLIDHGYNTAWSKWIPISSFELQSSRLTQNTLALYDGEISYPTSMELTNELRLSFVDDSFKSWKQYFKKCSEVSAYLSRVNSKEHYDEKYVRSGKGIPERDNFNNEGYITPVVIGAVHPAMYKNLAFRCQIYVMTPQFSTIQKLDLLIVLKNYQIEYQGESDSSPTDLTVEFSIVGENPEESSISRKYYDELGGRANSVEKIEDKPSAISSIDNKDSILSKSPDNLSIINTLDAPTNAPLDDSLLYPPVSLT